MTIPDSAVNARQGNMSALAGSHSVGVPAGALTVFLRMLWADSRSETSPQRVGCGISRHHSGKNARSARQRAGRRALSPVREQILSSVLLIEPVRSGFPKKRSLRGARRVRNLENWAKIEVENISILKAASFSRTIPGRTPQSASRTGNIFTACHGGG